MVEMSRAVDGIYIRVQRWASQQEGAGTVKPGMDDVVSRPLQRKREREEAPRLVLLLGSCQLILRSEVGSPRCWDRENDQVRKFWRPGLAAAAPRAMRTEDEARRNNSIRSDAR
jgi:hypothetical protein